METRPVALDPSLGIPVVYLVDDEDVVRDALAWLLRSRRLLSEGFASADAFEAWLAEQSAANRPAWPASPACLVLDVRMPGTSGLVLFERLAERGLLTLLPVIFLTGHGDVPMTVAAVKQGAFDFVEKPFSNNTLVDRVELALALSAQALRDRRDRVALGRALAELTDREREVMRRLALSESCPELAAALFLSPQTVEVHRRNIRRKLEVNTTFALGEYARAFDLI